VRTQISPGIRGTIGHAPARNHSPPRRHGGPGSDKREREHSPTHLRLGREKGGGSLAASTSEIIGKAMSQENVEVAASAP
jgi:hypothetical protein